MNKELALRTFAYLNRHYKTHNETIINKQEIEAIEFILNDNEFLEQQLHEASLTIQEMIEKDIWCPSNCEKLEKLQQENKQLQKELEEYKNPIKYFKYANKNVTEENKQLKDNWNELKEWASNFYNSEEVGWAGCGMRYTLEKIQELEQGSDNK